MIDKPITTNAERLKLAAAALRERGLPGDEHAARMVELCEPIAIYWRESYAAPFVPLLESALRLASDLGDDPMSGETRAAFAEIMRAAQRKHRAELAAERQAADDDVRAVAALLDATAEDAQPRNWTAARAMVRARFTDRIADLDARDAKALTPRTPIQGSRYTPLQLLGVAENDEEPTR